MQKTAFLLKIQSAEKSVIFFVPDLVALNRRAEVGDGKNKRRLEYLDDIPIAKRALNY